jgi:hypothetical protein
LSSSSFSVSVVRTVKPLSRMCLTQALQHPQVGLL